MLGYTQQGAFLRSKEQTLLQRIIRVKKGSVRKKFRKELTGKLNEKKRNFYEGKKVAIKCKCQALKSSDVKYLKKDGPINQCSAHSCQQSGLFFYFFYKIANYI